MSRIFDWITDPLGKMKYEIWELYFISDNLNFSTKAAEYSDESGEKLYDSVLDLKDNNESKS